MRAALRRARGAGWVGRSDGRAARCAGRRRGAPASRRRPRAPCSRPPRTRVAPWPRAARSRMASYSRRSSGGPRATHRAQRVEPRAPERLVSVDVADAGDERLVHDRRLQAPAARAQPLAGTRRSVKASSSGSGPKSREQLANFVALRGSAPGSSLPVQAEPPELAHVPDRAAIAAPRYRLPPATGPASSVEPQVDVAVVRRVRREDEELPGHLRPGWPGCRRRRGRRRATWPAGRRPSIARPTMPARERLRLGVADGLRPVPPGIGDRGAGEERREVARHRLDLGQLGHGRARATRAPVGVIDSQSSPVLRSTSSGTSRLSAPP